MHLWDTLSMLIKRTQHRTSSQNIRNENTDIVTLAANVLYLVADILPRRYS